MGADGLPRRAAPVFQGALGGSATLSDPVVLKEGRRCRVVRCRVAQAQGKIPSVILKEMREESARGFSDWASLAFLSGLPEARNVAPRFYAGDVAGRFFLMEDLGEGTALHDFLAGADSTASRAALRALASQMGCLHAATLGKEEAFEKIRRGLPGAEEVGRHVEAAAWLGNRGKLLAWFEALGCAPPSGFDTCLEHVAESYRQPGGYLAMTHGDPAPTNNHFTPNRAYLLDFEYGGFRHALYDITAWTILCPLPSVDAREMRQVFQRELAKACPEARDEERFGREWALVCAYRALALLTWMPPDIVGRNRPWADNWTMREAALVAMSRLEEIAGPVAPLEAAGKAAGALARAMRRQWPELGEAESLPKWPGLG